MSTSVLRDAFDLVVAPKMRCTAARLSYCGKDGGSSKRDHQMIEFDVINPADNSAQTVRSQPIPPGTDLITAVRALAANAVKAKEVERGTKA